MDLSVVYLILNLSVTSYILFLQFYRSSMMLFLFLLGLTGVWIYFIDSHTQRFFNTLEYHLQHFFSFSAYRTFYSTIGRDVILTMVLLGFQQNRKLKTVDFLYYYRVGIEFAFEKHVWKMTLYLHCFFCIFACKIAIQVFRIMNYESLRLIDFSCVGLDSASKQLRKLYETLG